MADSSGALAPNDFVSTFGDMLKANTAKDSSVAKLRSVRGRFEAMGANMRALDLVLKLRKMEDADAEMLLRDALRYARWLSMKIGDQAGLFSSDDAPPPSDKSRGELAEAEAYNEGYKAGAAGRGSTDHRYTPGTPVHQRWRQGWDDGQVFIAETWCIARPETGEAIKPPKKERAGTKAGASAAPAGKPRGRKKKGDQPSAAA